MGFKLGSIPIRIHPWFLLTVLIFTADDRNPAHIAIWLVVVLVSVLLHELGHALVGMAFGLVPRIDIHGMGGTTAFALPAGPPPKLTTAKNVAISLAGPFAGFFFGGIVVAAAQLGLVPAEPLVLYAVRTLQWVNIGWGIFNLLPMLPLDGGNVMRSVALAISKERGEIAARAVSLLIAVVAIVGYGALTRSWWILYLGVVFAGQNLQALRAARTPPATQAP